MSSYLGGSNLNLPLQAATGKKPVLLQSASTDQQRSWAWWRNGRVEAFRLEDCGLESRTSRHAGTLGL